MASSNPENMDDEDIEISIHENEPDERVSKTSSFESLFNYYFKLGSGSKKNYAMELMHHELWLSNIYNHKWEGIKIFYTSLQIGSYKIKNNEPIFITNSIIILRAPCATYSRNMRTMFLMRECLEKIILYHNSEDAMLFIQPNSQTCEIICKDLQIKHKSKPIYLDPTSNDHTKKFITISFCNAPETFADVLHNFFGLITCEIGADEARKLFNKCSQTLGQAKCQKKLDYCKNFDVSDSDFERKIYIEVPLTEPLLKFKLGAASKTIPEIHQIYKSCILDGGQEARFTKINIGTFKFTSDYLNEINLRNPNGFVFLRPDVIYFNAPHLTNHSQKSTIFILAEEVLKVETYTETFTSPPWIEHSLEEGDRIHVILTLKPKLIARVKEDLNLNAKSRGVFFDVLSNEDVGYHKIVFYMEERFQRNRQSIKFVEDFFQSNFDNVVEILDDYKGSKYVTSLIRSLSSQNYEEINELKHFILGSSSSKEPEIQSVHQHIIDKPFQYVNIESLTFGPNVVDFKKRLSFTDDCIYFTFPRKMKPKEKILIVIFYNEITKMQAYEDCNNVCLFLTLLPQTLCRICGDLEIQRTPYSIMETTMILSIRSSSIIPSLTRMKELFRTKGNKIIIDISFEACKSLEDSLLQQKWIKVENKPCHGRCKIFGLRDAPCTYATEKADQQEQQIDLCCCCTIL